MEWNEPGKTKRFGHPIISSQVPFTFPFFSFYLKMDEIVSLILSPRWKSLSFFSVVLKKTTSYGSTHIESRVQSWNLTGRLAVWRAAGCLVSICQMIVCVRLARQEMREKKRWNKRWKPEKNENKKGGHPPNPLAIAAASTTPPSSHFPTHSFTEKNQEKRRETAMEMERGKSFLLLL